VNNHLDYPQILTITIISSQFLSRSSSKTSDIPDPYVSVSTHGLACDERVFKTKVIENNGFNPTWNEKFTFRIQHPQMALLYFAVYDYDSFTRDDKLAQFCLPVTMIQTGRDPSASLAMTIDFSRLSSCSPACKESFFYSFDSLCTC
jgi:Ca2+-dependent lipid-binding protein